MLSLSISLSLSLSLSLSCSLSVSHCLCSLSLYISLSLSLPLSLSLSLSVCALSPSLSLSLHLSLCLFLFVCLYLSVSSCLSLFVFVESLFVACPCLSLHLQDAQAKRQTHPFGRPLWGKDVDCSVARYACTHTYIRISDPLQQQLLTDQFTRLSSIRMWKAREIYKNPVAFKPGSTLNESGSSQAQLREMLLIICSCSYDHMTCGPVYI